MKKFIPLIIVGILVLSGLGTTAFTIDNADRLLSTQRTESEQISFSTPTLSMQNGFSLVAMSGTTSQLIEPNEPTIPIYVKTYQIPFHSQNIQVSCTPENIQTMTLDNDILPAVVAPVSQDLTTITPIEDPVVYGSNALYPSSWFTVDLGSGRNSDDREVTFVKVICYPVRYAPADNRLDYASDFHITLHYDAPTHPTQTAATEDLVIIAPRAFKNTLQPLIDFKNSKGLNTTFKSIEDIFKEYQGADPPEQVKMYIKDAYDTSGITYALLVGGLKSHLFANDKENRSYGSKAWWVPVRYVNIPDDDDEGCLCDLYYGCLYNGTGGFDSWDSNGDGIYAAWDAGSGIPNDDFDMNPEVYVSRLPVTNRIELKQVVDKIITYESSGPEAKPWYDTMIGIGGKTFSLYQGKPDGEYLTDLAISYMQNGTMDLNPIRIYSSNRDTGGLVPIPKDIIKTISEGAGFVDFEGHGNPVAWNTIWFDGVYPDNWTGGLNLFLFWLLSNAEKLPVVVVGGCHNALYNVSVIPSMKDRDGIQQFTYGVPAPVCFCWGLILKRNGGAIASTGCTGYGIGNPSNPVSLSAELESNFFYEIGVNGSTNLGQAHGQAISKFIADEAVGHTEAFCITNWALLGDPSLRLGGYSS